MIIGKQRAYLRSLANGLPAILQIGKEGIAQNLIKQVDDALSARELIKMHVLETAPVTPREACDELARLTNAEPVQVIGGKIVLYREAKEEEKRKIVLPKVKKTK